MGVLDDANGGAEESGSNGACAMQYFFSSGEGIVKHECNDDESEDSDAAIEVEWSFNHGGRKEIFERELNLII